MKKILIFTAGFGEGHNTAARNIRDALELVAPDEVSVQVVDLFDRCYGKLNEFLRKAYIAAINRTPRVWGKIYSVIDGTQFVESNMVMLAKMKRSMTDLLSQIEPDAIVSTYPLYNYVIDEVYPEGEPHPFSQITVVTDSITVNSVWYRSASDYFIVANEDTAAVLRAGGVTDDRIRIFGFPVTHRFAEMTDHRYDSSDTGPRRVLYMINSGKKEAPALVRRLSRRSDVRLTVTVGRDVSLRREIEVEAKSPAHPVDILGWTTKMPELLTSHHVIITKAGGATVQEAIAARTPVIISQVVPGQEESGRCVCQWRRRAESMGRQHLSNKQAGCFIADSSIHPRSGCIGSRSASPVDRSKGTRPGQSGGEIAVHSSLRLPFPFRFLGWETHDSRAGRLLWATRIRCPLHHGSHLRSQQGDRQNDKSDWAGTDVGSGRGLF